MSVIDYREGKALLITSRDLIKINTIPSYAAAIKLMVDARTFGGKHLESILVLTSMNLSDMPKWLREHLDHEIHCYRGFIRNSEGTQ